MRLMTTDALDASRRVNGVFPMGEGLLMALVSRVLVLLEAVLFTSVYGWTVERIAYLTRGPRLTAQFGTAGQGVG